MAKRRRRDLTVSEAIIEATKMKIEARKEYQERKLKRKAIKMEMFDKRWNKYLAIQKSRCLTTVYLDPNNNETDTK